ncbi:beta/gamma crystallin-related protein [Paucibacter sp. B2R-40]|uniref:beta/gamma crystallin-related protein n=1 Tax=Paucibacter sp. B2R-40 TaxID=2893554 RepID=UPI0021E37EC2|nr:beta/gamma crystallin-related protein [Paucibacter sp. B2R-40]MCV2356509.1 beta/gamma crystallin-related protein [Paucibacter sp. B2R-40]
MSPTLKLLAAAAGLALAAQASAQITFYEHDNFGGRSFKTQNKVSNLQRYGFNDLASSAVVSSDRWEICDQQNFGGRCVILRRGNYLSLSAMGLNDRISSARAVPANQQYEEQRYAPAPVSVYDSRRRNDERLYEAEVTSVRAVMGKPQQRCWVEQQQVSQASNANVPGALVGGLLGGVLGHQVGGGRGRDLATVGGVVAGAAIGSQVNGNSPSTRAQDVQRCSSDDGNGQPEYWDVGYQFRGQAHHVQMNSAPGRTVIVNRQGEPRT